MIKDLRYVIKKILIGIGICLGLFYLKSCNVYAQNIKHIEYVEPFYNYTFDYDLDLDTYSHYFLKIKYSSTQVRYDLYYFNGDVTFECYWSTNCNVNGTIDTTKNRTIRAKRNESFSSVVYSKIYTISNNTYTTSTTNNPIFYETNFDSFNLATDTNNGVNIYTGNPILLLINYDLSVNNNAFSISKEYYNNNNLFDPTPPPPTIDSLNPTLNKTSEGMLVSVSFNIEFSYVNNDDYNYYAWFEGNDKFQLTTNNVVLNTQQNTTLYVEITDKQGNTIDTETYTVSSIGLIYNGSYDIQFIITELTNSDTTNDSDLVIDEINRVDIDITYIPKWVNYKYQYQWVNQNDSLTNNWVTINNNSDLNNYTYTTRVNGILYTRILDIDNNVLKSSSYTITRIGQLKTYDKNSGRIFNMFNNLNNDINFGGPISNLIVMPVNVLETILQVGSTQCSPYYLGTIGGHPLTLTCVNPEDYLGSSLWSLIDIIVSGCLVYSIAKWLTSLYWNFVMLQNTPDINPESFGDRRDLL